MEQKYQQSNYAKKIGRRIREERESRGITQTKMAELLYISASYYNNIENGNRICPLEILIQICRIFSISADRVLRDFVPLSSVAASDIAQMLEKLVPEERTIIYNMIKSYSESKL